ncbi:IS4 family transposase, partial [Actinocrinis puniceicyclus]
MSKSATVTLSRAITVAEGVFAPGHLGELTQVVPFELVDAVLAETGTVQRRLRDLPSRVGVYVVLAMAMFETVGVAGVWSKLTAGLSGYPVSSASEKALRDLRRRVGPAPLKALFDVLAGPLAQPHTPGVRYRGLRTVAFDGCSSIKVPDAERNRGRFGKIKYRLGFAGYPALMLMALVETGTRGVIGAVFGPTAPGERAYAAKLLHHLRAGMLILNDRGFDGNDLLEEIVATGAHFLVRAKASRRPAVAAVLPDGSYLARIGGLTLRVIEAKVTVTGADGSVVTGVYRLLTTLTCHRTDPAPVLIDLYRERWEVESAFFAFRHTILRGRVLRSKDPVGIEQEMWALLVLYQVLRTVMVDAAECAPGTDPDRCGFTIALQAARESVVTAANIVTPDVDLVGDIGRAVLAGLLPARRHRFSARKVKSPISRYHAHTDTNRPLTSTTVAAVEVVIREPPTPTPRPPRKPKPQRSPRTRRTQPTRRPATRPASGRPPGRRAAVLQLMGTRPGQPWRARDLARAFDITEETGLNSFC